MTTIESILEHHGVKGQKWGVRTKTRVKSARKTAPVTQDHKKTAELRKRKRSQLTNKQLDTVNTRLSKEQNFSRLNPSNVQKGHSFVRAFLALGATGAALFKLSKTPTGQRVISIGKTFINVQITGKAVNSRKIDVSKFQKSAQGKLF